MPITTDFIAAWFLFSGMIFLAFTSLGRVFYQEQPDRDFNTFLIICSQGLGALAAYALH